MKSDIYSYVFRGRLAEEALDKVGRQNYHPEAIYYSEDVAKKLSLHEIDEKYVQRSKSMITVFAAITAFENATRDYVYKVLVDAYKTDWWNKGIQGSIKIKAESRKEKESKIRWHVNRGDEMMSYLDFGDLAKTMTSSDNWNFFEPDVVSQEWVKNLFEDVETSRNVIMHSGILDDYDISRVGMNIRDWLRQINA